MHYLHRALTRSLILLAAPMFAVAVHADPASPRAAADEPRQGFIVSVPPISSATAANKVADEPQALRSTQVQVQAYREDLAAPCDRRQGTGREACRAQLAAKYAAMDKLCRAVSAAEFPTCIKSAYAAD